MMRKRKWPTKSVKIPAGSETIRQHSRDVYEVTHKEMQKQERARWKAAQSALTRRVPG